MIVKRVLKRTIYSIERQLYLSGLLSLRRLTLPNFLVLGSGQSGSSWLQDNLCCHPEVFLPSKKETHYFSREFHKWPLGYYASLFAKGEDKIRGEITPIYTLLKPDRIRFIQKIMPEVRLIIIIRNPIERAWSAGRRVISKVAPSLGTTFDEIDDAEFYEFFRKEWTYRPERGMAGYFESGLLQGEYSRAIDKWLTFFPQQQLLVCFFEELRTDPKSFLIRICNHIGASTDIDWRALPLSKVVNKNPGCAMPDRFRVFLEDLYRPEIEELQKRFAEQTIGWT